MGASFVARHRRWAGTLLLLVQLLPVAVVPLLHSGAHFPVEDHVEAPGTHPGSHGSVACHACRALDARYSPAALAGVAAHERVTPEYEGAHAPSPAPARPFYLPSAPRGPPVA